MDRIFPGSRVRRAGSFSGKPLRHAPAAFIPFLQDFFPAFYQNIDNPHFRIVQVRLQVSRYSLQGYKRAFYSFLRCLVTIQP
jgi:hypothetical protein